MVTYARPGGFTEEWVCNAIAVCSDLHVLPNIPYPKGIEHIPKVLPSSEYKHKKPVRDQQKRDDSGNWIDWNGYGVICCEIANEV